MPPEMRNRVILATRPEAQAFIAARMEVRPLVAGQVIYEVRQLFTHCVFPHQGILSMQTDDSGRDGVEKASIGNEGFLGFTYLMGSRGAISRAVVQVSGYASFLAIADLEEAMREFVCVRDAMLAYSKALIVQLMETVGCNGVHSAEQRVCRWLLHADDRMDNQMFLLTQESLARSLGLRRATVSEICSNLMRDGAISYSRGTLHVTDRKHLRNHACDCYDRIADSNTLQPWRTTEAAR